MCIVCEIKNKLLTTGIDAESLSFVLRRLNIMAACLDASVNQGRSIMETRKINRTKLGEVLELSSALLSDSDSAVKQREQAMTNADAVTHPVERIIQALEKLLSKQSGNYVKPDGLPQEVWDSMPQSLREMLDGALVLSSESIEPTRH